MDLVGWRSRLGVLESGSTTRITVADSLAGLTSSLDLLSPAVLPASSPLAFLSVRSNHPELPFPPTSHQTNTPHPTLMHYEGSRQHPRVCAEHLDVGVC